MFFILMGVGTLGSVATVPSTEKISKLKLGEGVELKPAESGGRDSLSGLGEQR